MTESQYWTRITFWTALYFGLPFLVQPIVRSMLLSQGADSIGGAMGAGTLVYSSFAVMGINLLITLGLCWTAFGRLREIGWSVLWVLFLYFTLSGGLMNTAATPFAGYRFSMMFGWALIPAVGFLIFLGVFDGGFKNSFFNQGRVSQIAKIVAISLAVLFTLLTLKSGILNLKPIPYMTRNFMALADWVPGFNQYLFRPAYWFGTNIFLFRNILSAIFLLALGVYWYMSDYYDADEDTDDYKPQGFSYQPQNPAPQPQGFGQRRY